MTDIHISPSRLPVRFVCRKCSEVLSWGQDTCPKCKTGIICGFPLLIDFPLGLAFGIAFNIIKMFIVMLVSLGFLISLPSRWYYPIYPRRARFRLCFAVKSVMDLKPTDLVQLEVDISDWRRKPLDQIDVNYLTKRLYTEDCSRLLEVSKNLDSTIDKSQIDDMVLGQFLAQLEQRVAAARPRK